MEIISKIMYTGLVLGVFFGLLGAATSVGTDDKTIEKINDVLIILTGACFILSFILIVFRLLILIWR